MDSAYSTRVPEHLAHMLSVLSTLRDGGAPLDILKWFFPPESFTVTGTTKTLTSWPNWVQRQHETHSCRSSSRCPCKELRTTFPSQGVDCCYLEICVFGLPFLSAWPDCSMCGQPPVPVTLHRRYGQRFHSLICFDLETSWNEFWSHSGT